MDLGPINTHLAGLEPHNTGLARSNLVIPCPEEPRRQGASVKHSHRQRYDQVNSRATLTC